MLPFPAPAPARHDSEIVRDNEPISDSINRPDPAQAEPAEFSGFPEGEFPPPPDRRHGTGFPWLRIPDLRFDTRHALKVCGIRSGDAIRNVALLLHPLAILAGLAVGWQWSGLRVRILSTLDPLSTTTAMTAVIALLCAAAGPWLPERLASPINRVAGRLRRMPDDSAPGHGPRFWVLRALHEHDEPLNWLLLSLLALVAGTVSLLTLAMIPVMGGFHHLMIERFFWTNLTLAGLEWIAVTLLIGWMWMIHGLVIAALDPVVRQRGNTTHSATGIATSLIVGLGAAFATRPLWQRWELSGGQEMMLGAMLMFVLAAWAVWTSQHHEARDPVPDSPPPAAPEVSPRAEGLIWLLITVWGFATILSAAGWLRSIAPTSPPAGSDRAGLLFLGMVPGLIAASIHAARRSSILSGPSGCGMAVWAAGLGAGVAVTIASFAPASPWAVRISLLALAVPAGFTLHYLERAWLARSGVGALGFAQFASAVCTGCAVGLIAAEWWALPGLGAAGTLALGSLLMLVSGGLLQIHEQDRPIRTRHQRLGLVFASLAAAIVVFPGDTQRWSRWARARTVDRTMPTDLHWLADMEPFHARDICLIGVDAASVAGVLDDIQRASVMPMTRSAAAPRWPDPRDNPRVFQVDAFRALRIERGRYHLIYQQGHLISPTPRFGEYSIEWFDRLAGHLQPGGRLIVDVPLTGMTPRAVAIIAATFHAVVDDSSRWSLAYPGGRPVLRLHGRIGSRTTAARQRLAETGPDHADTGALLAVLLTDRDARFIHSVSRDRLSSTLRQAAPNGEIRMIQWLAERLAAVKDAAPDLP